MSTILSLTEYQKQYETACSLGEDMSTHQQVFLSDKARLNGWHIIGGIGSGKTTLKVNTFLQDIIHGHGGMYLTPDPDAIVDIISFLPEVAIKRTILLDPSDEVFHLGLNPLACQDYTQTKKVEEALNRTLHIFKKIWGRDAPESAWGAQLEDILSHLVLTLIYNRLTLAEAPLLLREDPAYRNACIRHIADHHLNADVVRFWQNDFDRWPYRQQLLDTRSTLNKIRAFLRVERIKFMVGQATATINWRFLMDNHMIVLVPLSEQALGDEAVQLIGTILVAGILDAALSRADIDKSQREFFGLFIDEFELFASADFQKMLERVRKYGVAVAIAHQTLGQLREESLRQAVDQTANKTHMASLTPHDAEYYAPLYAREPEATDTRREVQEALTLAPVEKLAACVHENETIQKFTATYLTDLVNWIPRLNNDTLLDRGDGYLATIDQLNTGKTLLNTLFTDVAQRKLVLWSPEMVERVIQIALHLRGLIRFVSGARYGKSLTSISHFYQSVFRKTYEYYTEEIALPHRLKSQLTTYLHLLLGSPQNPVLLPLSVCRDFGLAQDRLAKAEKAVRAKETEGLHQAVAKERENYPFRKKAAVMPTAADLNFEEIQQDILLYKALEKDPHIAPLLAPYRQATFGKGFLKIRDEASSVLQQEKETAYKQWQLAVYSAEIDRFQKRYLRTKQLFLDQPRFLANPPDEKALVCGFLLSTTKDLVDNATLIEGIAIPWIAGVPPDAICDTIVKLALEFEARERAQLVKARLQEKITRAEAETEVWVHINQSAREQLTKQYFAKLQAERAQAEGLRTFVRSLFTVCQLLLFEENLRQLKVPSGVKEVEGNKPSEADMVGAARRNLLDLEPLSAWCRIQDPKAKEGEKIKKHKIKVPLFLFEELNGQTLQDRIAAIREQSLATYYTPREQVAKEIRARQEAFLNQPQEEDTPPPSQAPPDDEPPPTVAGA